MGNEEELSQDMRKHAHSHSYGLGHEMSVMRCVG